MDPTTGRFQTPDPLGLLGGINSYVYGENDPTNTTDPNGLCPWCVAAIGAVVGGVIGAGSSIAVQYMENGHDVSQINWKSVAVAGVVGAGTGAAAPFVATDLVAGAALGAVSNVVQYGLTNYVNGQHGSTSGLVVSAVVGAAAGGASGTFARVDPRWDNSLGLLDQGVVRSLNSADAARSLIQQTLAPINVARSCGVSVAASVDLDRLWDRTGRYLGAH